MITLQHDGLSRPLVAPRFRALSLGLGVQSTAVALMAERGDIPEKLDFAVFSDTVAEPAFVYRHLEWLRTQVSYPIIVVSAGSLEQDLLNGFATGSRYASIPAFVRGPDGKPGIVGRQCTKEYKVEPIEKLIRQTIGLKPRQSIRHFLGLKRDEPTPAIVEQWLGISTDEIQRVTPSGKPYIHNRHPLIEARMSRNDCIQYLTERQYPVPAKSACVFCPYKDAREWLFLKEQHPDEFARAVRVDRAIRAGNPRRGLNSKVMALHRSLQPLEDVDFSAPEEQAGFGFVNDCMGRCGV